MASTPTIPTLHTNMAGAEITRRLDAAARKGRLPGLKVENPPAGGLFEVRELGRPFESSMIARCSPRSASGDQCEIEFELRVRPMVPVIFAVVLIASIWPGIYVVDSMLKQYFSWYSSIETWWWYLPLTVPTSPWAFWGALKKSRENARTEATEIVKKIGAEIGASEAAPR